jgi:hypothetical protein
MVLEATGRSLSGCTLVLGLVVEVKSGYPLPLADFSLEQVRWLAVALHCYWS